ncbi:hypothetical protein [Microbacterium sp. YJN-G]|uniref:hypothetical protein n=1 Tax=Microbacterium sp. YJN-G TaxID=2763257 RepID=UPI00187848A6|nr:hypothetical protein [Microbacterium sp. YJN-G]
MKTRTSLTAVALLAALTLTACSGTQTETAPTSSPTKTPEMPKATVTTAPVESTPPPTVAETPTCGTLISSATVDALTAQGWTYKEREFRIGDVVVEGGLECLWADYTTASDHGQMYGWGPLSADAARTAQSNLQRDAWLRSTEGDLVYFTEDPATAIATDDAGYGMTYEFGDGWVKFADTKQGLLLIEWEN